MKDAVYTKFVDIEGDHFVVAAFDHHGEPRVYIEPIGHSRGPQFSLAADEVDEFVYALSEAVKATRVGP